MFSEEPEALGLKSDIYNKKGKQKPLVITKTKYSPNLFRNHPLFVEDKLHRKIVYGRKDKFADMQSESPDINEVAKFQLNTEFRGMDQPNLHTIINDLQTKENSKFIFIENGFESMVKM